MESDDLLEVASMRGRPIIVRQSETDSLFESGAPLISMVAFLLLPSCSMLYGCDSHKLNIITSSISLALPGNNFETSSSLNTDRNKSVPRFFLILSKYHRSTERERASHPPSDRRLLSLWNRDGEGRLYHEQKKI